MDNIEHDKGDIMSGAVIAINQAGSVGSYFICPCLVVKMCRSLTSDILDACRISINRFFVTFFFFCLAHVFFSHKCVPDCCKFIIF